MKIKRFIPLMLKWGSPATQNAAPDFRIQESEFRSRNSCIRFADGYNLLVFCLCCACVSGLIFTFFLCSSSSVYAYAYEQAESGEQSGSDNNAKPEIVTNIRNGEGRLGTPVPPQEPPQMPETAQAPEVTPSQDIVAPITITQPQDISQPHTGAQLQESVQPQSTQTQDTTPHAVTETQESAQPQPATNIQQSAQPQPAANLQQSTQPQSTANIQQSTQPQSAANLQQSAQPQSNTTSQPNATTQSQEKSQVWMTARMPGQFSEQHSYNKGISNNSQQIGNNGISTSGNVNNIDEKLGVIGQSDGKSRLNIKIAKAAYNSDQLSDSGVKQPEESGSLQDQVRMYPANEVSIASIFEASGTAEDALYNQSQYTHGNTDNDNTASNGLPNSDLAIQINNSDQQVSVYGQSAPPLSIDLGITASVMLGVAAVLFFALIWVKARIRASA